MSGVLESPRVNGNLDVVRNTWGLARHSSFRQPQRKAGHRQFFAFFTIRNKIIVILWYVYFLSLME